MSNPDLPGSYWQEQDEPLYRAGRPAGPDRYQPRGDGRGDRDWRPRSQGGKGASGARHSRGSGRPFGVGNWAGNGNGNGRAAGNGNGRAAGNGNGNGNGRAAANGNGRAAANGSGREAPTWTGMISRQARGGQRQRRDSRWQDWAGGFAQTADDLRNRFSRRGSAANRGGAAWPSRPGSAADGPAGSRTALRDDYRPDGTRTSRLTGSRTAIRPGPGAGGMGGGRGGGHGRGGGGGRWDPRHPGSRGERFLYWLRSGTWWRHWTWKKAVAVVGGAIAGMVLLGIGTFFIMYVTTPIPTAESAQLKGVSSTAYFSNGQLLGTFTNGGFDHQLLAAQQVPLVMKQAIIAAEDRHFYSEGGVSITGIIRAAKNDLSGSGNLQGASTITEQYVKNYYQSLSNIASTQSISYKIKEVIVAIKIAHEKSKSWILTSYLNSAPFGPTTYGLGAATQQYFGINLTKPGATLTVAQAAMLAAIPNNPAVLSPYPSAGIGYQMLVGRWQYVLNYMVTDNALSQKQANALCANCSLANAEKAFAANVKVQPPGATNGWNGVNGYLMQMVQQELEGTYHYTAQQIDSDGLQITTTFSPAMMTGLTNAVNAEKQQMVANGGALPSYDLLGGALVDPKTGGILGVYGGPGYGAPNCNGVCQLNMAESPHAVGSSFKPYVLATAISQGMNVQTSILNGYSPLWIPPDWTLSDRLQLSQQKNPYATTAQATANGWWLSNSEGVGGGPLPVPEATAISSDPAFGDLTHRVGVQNIINMVQNFGVGSTPLTYESLVQTANGHVKYVPNDLVAMQDTFGSNGVYANSIQITYGQPPLTAIEQASMMATLADDGLFHTPHVIAKLYQGSTEVPLKIQTRQVISPAAAADEDYALSFVSQAVNGFAGTAYPNASLNRPMIGKTGTLGIGNQVQDAWFVGAIPQYSVAIGLFTNNNNETLNALPNASGQSGGFGGSWPASIWRQFMTSQFGGLPAAQFPTPDYNGFQKWIQVNQKPQNNCGSQGSQGSQGHGNDHHQGNTSQCPGSQPSPPSCQQGAFGGFGGCPGSQPSPSCPPGGLPCPNPSPSASTPSPGQSSGGNGTGTAVSASIMQATTTALVESPQGTLTAQQLAVEVRGPLLV